MSEEENTPSELDSLKERAGTLGIKFHPNIGIDALRDRVNEALKSDEEKDDQTNNTPTADGNTEAGEEGETEGQRRSRKKKEAGEMVRIMVTCMNPNKKEYEGEIFTTGNSVIGTYKKYVPFGIEWHVPRVIYNMIKQRKCQVFKSRRDERGRNVKEGKLIQEFAVEKLEPLTEAELKDLAQRQAMAQGTSAAA